MGGFQKNSELLFHFDSRDDASGSMAAAIRKELKSYFSEPTASFACHIDLERYRYWKARFQRPLGRAQESDNPKKRATKDLLNVDILNLDWPQFLEQIGQDPNHSIDGRIKVLGAARDLFRTHDSLASMPVAARKGIGGYVNSVDLPWGWFGSMKGAGEFKKLMNRNPMKLSDALDEIPLEGRVQRSDYEAFVGKFISAFPLKNELPWRHGLATASRLLAMKRPDYFVCLDAANRLGVGRAFGLSLVKRDYEGYWDSIIERIIEAKWWNSRRPRALREQSVWDGRTAFLDAIFYQPMNRNES